MRISMAWGLVAATVALALPACATDLRKDGTLIYDDTPNPVYTVMDTGLRKNGTLIYDEAPGPSYTVMDTGLRKNGTLIYDEAPSIDVQCAIISAWMAYPLMPMPAPVLPAAWRGVF